MNLFKVDAHVTTTKGSTKNIGGVHGPDSSIPVKMCFLPQHQEEFHILTLKVGITLLVG